MRIKSLSTILIIILLTSCEVLNKMADVVELPDTATENMPLSEQEVISGLKETLRISTDTAVATVSRQNGFFGDELIKIMLPPEAKVIVDNKDNTVLKSLGISKMIDDVILRMNRSAEESSKKAIPVFTNSIKSMTITDAFAILHGSDTAATHYFRMNTYSKLFKEFKPVISEYLNRDIVDGVSTNEAWNTLTKAYNKVAGFSSSLTPVNTNLEDYVTGKTIDGLFVKLADEEKQIRKDPTARVTDILKKVFGS